MKIYFIYLKFAYDDLWKVNKFLPNRHDWEYIDKSHSDKCAILYAWTTNKKLKNRFLKSRTQGKFNVYKRDLDDETLFQDYTSDPNFKALELSECEFCDGTKDEKVTLPCTLNEFFICTDYISEYGEEVVATLMDKLMVDYTFLNEKYRMALDRLGYNNLYDSYVAGDENYYCDESREIRMSIANDCDSYNQSVVYGFNLPKRLINPYAEFSALRFFFEFAL